MDNTISAKDSSEHFCTNVSAILIIKELESLDHRLVGLLIGPLLFEIVQQSIKIDTPSTAHALHLKNNLSNYMKVEELTCETGMVSPRDLIRGTKSFASILPVRCLSKKLNASRYSFSNSCGNGYE
jgi:hypothetical protein